MAHMNRPFAFWIMAVFIAISIAVMLAGQTIAVFDYELAVRLGLQETREQVGEFGIQVNRAFGAGDTIVYIPLMSVSLIGLYFRKRWSLLTTAAVAGVSAYWSATVLCMLLFLPGTPGYSYVPGVEIWLFVGAFAAFGIWSLLYLLSRGDELLR